MSYTYRMKRNKVQKTFVFILVLFLSLGVEFLFARAGGGGSRSSSSGGGGGGGLGVMYLIFYLIRILPFPFNIIAIGIIFFVLFKGSRKVRNDGSAFRSFQGQKDSVKAEGYTDFLIHHPDFDEAGFKKKVQKAFTAIQKAWTEKKIAGARRYITDGIYQRFLTQIKMMDLLKQTDTISDIDIINIWIDRIEEDGEYDIIHAGIHASMKDIFRSELSDALNSRVDDEFIEYWSFIRRKSSKNKDLYGTVACPNCGAPLTEEHLDVVKCTFCGTLLNNGEYDWILSEITQANDYAASRRSIRKIEAIKSRISQDALSNEASIQLIEDKASNGYLQILSAVTSRDLRGIKRFTSSSFAQKLQQSLPEETIAFNRIYLNNVSVIGADRREDINRLFIAVRSSFQRISVENGKIKKRIDPFVVTKTEVLVMNKKVHAGRSKGSLYAGSCPACGAPVEDPFAVKCSFCGTEYNREDKEWIIDNILSMEEYAALSSGVGTKTVKPGIIDALYDVRDYALNNIMMIIAADGVYDEQEQKLVEGIARKFGYNPDILTPLFKQASSGRLAIKMPEDRKKRTKIYSLMVKAAMADNSLSREEKKLLDQVKEVYLSA